MKLFITTLFIIFFSLNANSAYIVSSEAKIILDTLEAKTVQRSNLERLHAYFKDQRKRPITDPI